MSSIATMQAPVVNTSFTAYLHERKASNTDKGVSFGRAG
jgi:hypothetical protein